MEATVRTPTLLWIAAAYWAISGIFGLAPFVMAPSFVFNLHGAALAFVLMAALSHVFSLAGAALLVLRRKLAIPTLIFVFVLGAGWLAVLGKSPADLSAFTAATWLFGAATVAYAFVLYRRGVLK